MREILIEDIDLDSMVCEVLEEKAGKKYSIRGPFIEANIKNKNDRIYPGPIVRPQIEKYQKVIEQNRAVGELNHPATLEIDPKNISHKITSLKFEGENIVMGEATIGATKNGLTVRALMDMGIKLGVSSRGAGTLKDGIVQKDYKYVCNDIVWEPSAPSAFVEGVLEAKTEWLLENDILVEKDIEDLIGQLAKFGRKNINTVRLDIFEQALDKALHNSRNQ